MSVVDGDPVVDGTAASAAPRSRAFAEAVLPQAPPSALPRGRLAAGYGAAFAAAMAFQLLMPAGWSRLERVWAEDGARFLLDGITQPFTANLVAPYGGYLHVLPRLAAELVSVLPLEWAAVAFTVLAAVPRALVALLVFTASGGYLRPLPVRFAHAALVVVLPAGNSEPLDNVANLHWFLLYGVFWALLWRSGPRVPVTAFVVLAALSSPLVFVLVPVALLRLAVPRGRVVPLAFLAAAAVQGLVMVFAERTPYSHDPADPVQVLLAGLLRVPVVAFLGSEQVERYYPVHGNLPVLGALLLAGLPVLAGLRWGDRAGRLLVVLGVGYGALVIAGTLVANWTRVLQVQQPGVVTTGQRYSVAPCLFLFSAVAVGLALVPRERWARLAVGAGRVVVAVVVLYSVVQHVRVDGGVLDGVPWGESVARGRGQCAAGAPVARFEHEPENWFFEVPCHHLDR
ncbi:hypothetical protein [Saccharothrix syringae]|uniref:DUF2029 domain-containing protein n=1 Tax=Saccharothrix syringae TaxID=103733 RepID=A0A1X9WEM3_SACSY|nr:hypothetical protein [Saccharothrix syringae]ARS01463.1 hypothetical protein [Saccharothrix syringae]QFZ19267.1 hypothetical protein EKG83_19105 [Saccharothrix syringae]